MDRYYLGLLCDLPMVIAHLTRRWADDDRVWFFTAIFAMTARRHSVRLAKAGLIATDHSIVYDTFVTCV